MAGSGTPLGAPVARATEIPSGIVFAHTGVAVASWLSKFLRERSVERAVLVSGAGSRDVLGRSLAIDVGAQVALTGVEVSSCEWAETERVAAAIEAAGATAVVGVGGGRSLDVAKYAASEAGLPFVAVPTQASHDGMCSPVAVLRGPGDKGTDSYGARPPMALVVPVFAIAQAPRRTLVSGMADLSVNGLAIMDWEWARELHGEPFDDYAALLGRSAAELILARRDLYEPGRRFTDEDVEILVHGLVLSGLAMTVAGSSRPCSGPEHLISHAFDALGLGEGLHGEQVALGARVAVRFLGPAGGRVVELLDRIGAPRSPDEIGIGRDDALRAVRIAGSVRPERRSRLAAALAADPDHVVAEAEAAWYG